VSASTVSTRSTSRERSKPPDLAASGFMRGKSVFRCSAAGHWV
jgi:hypothetical protein